MSRLDSISGNIINKPSVTITEADVDKVLYTMRKQRAKWVPVKRPARLEDQVLISYSLAHSDEIIEESEATNRFVVLGTGDFHLDLERDYLVGARTGDSISAEATLPNKPSNANLTEKQVSFTISVNAVNRPVLPALNKQFAKELGLEKGGPKTLHRETLAVMQRQVDSMIKQILRTQIFDILLSKYQLEIDENYIQDEINVRKQAKAKNHKKTHHGDKLSEPTAEQLTDLVKLHAIMKDIIRTKRLVIDTKRLDISVTAMALRADKPDKVVNKYYDDFDELSRLEAEMLEDQVIECMFNFLDVKSVSMTYEQFMSAINSSWQISQLSNWPIIQLRKDNKCEFCSASKCCQYVTQKIPSPRSKRDFKQLLWQVSHDKAKVFKDRDGWHLLFETPCSNLQIDGRCGIYESRPQICSDYSVERCEFDGSAEDGWDLTFDDYESLLKYCQSRFKRWDKT